MNVTFESDSPVAAWDSMKPLVDLWASMLDFALGSLEVQSLKAAYVMDDESDPAWSLALQQSGFRSDGIVDRLGRPAIHETTLLNHGPPESRVNDFPWAIERQAASTFAGGDNPQIARTRKAIVNLIRDTIRHGRDGSLRKQVEASDVLDLFVFNPGHLEFLVAMEDSTPIGILVGDISEGPNRGHIEYLGVHSEHRRQGIAGELLNQYADALNGEGVSVAVHRSNQASQAFFLSQNFGRSEQYQLLIRDI